MRDIRFAGVLGMLLMVLLFLWDLKDECRTWPWKMEEGVIHGFMVVVMWLMIVVLCWWFIMVVIPDLLRSWQRPYVMR